MGCIWQHPSWHQSPGISCVEGWVGFLKQHDRISEHDFIAKYRTSNSAADEITRETFLKRSKRKQICDAPGRTPVWMNASHLVKTTRPSPAQLLGSLSAPEGISETAHPGVAQVPYWAQQWLGRSQRSAGPFPPQILRKPGLRKPQPLWTPAEGLG